MIVAISCMVSIYAKNDVKTNQEQINQKLAQIEHQYPAIYNHLCLMLIDKATRYVGNRPDILQEQDLIDQECKLKEGVAHVLDKRITVMHYINHVLYLSNM